MTERFFRLISYLSNQIPIDLHRNMFCEYEEGVMSGLRKKREEEDAKERKEREEREEIEFLLTGGYERDCCHA